MSTTADTVFVAGSTFATVELSNDTAHTECCIDGQDRALAHHSISMTACTDNVDHATCRWMDRTWSSCCVSSSRAADEQAGRDDYGDQNLHTGASTATSAKHCIESTAHLVDVLVGHHRRQHEQSTRCEVQPMVHSGEVHQSHGLAVVAGERCRRQHIAEVHVQQRADLATRERQTDLGSRVGEMLFESIGLRRPSASRRRTSGVRTTRRPPRWSPDCR